MNPGLGMEEPIVDSERLDHLLSQIKDYQITHGFLLKGVRLEQRTTVPCRPVNVSILPTPFPRDLFEDAMDLQDLYTDLYIRASSDPEWLYAVLDPLLKPGSVVKALWDIWIQVQQTGVVQDVVCGIFRSDYMLHHTSRNGPVALKQVEMNTLCIAGACHAERASDLHSHLKRMKDLASIRQQRPASQVRQDEGSLPLNDNMLTLISALKAAHDTYTPSTPHPTCVLMPVQPTNFNIADERPLEYGLWDESIPCYRCDWPDIISQTTLTPDRSLLFQRFDLTFEVSLVYYRAGYEAHEYATPSGISTRLRLELSRAIKCPDVLTHLTTFKSVQAALTHHSALAYLDISPDDQARLAETFMPMFSLADPGCLKLVQNTPEIGDWILKPNLEGGGHNIHGPSIPAFISDLPQSSYADYTLMQRIRPPEQKGVLMLPDQVYQGPVISELGVIGTCLWRRNAEEKGVREVLRKETAGWTFKTKPAGVDEMSVVKGYGCFDCPLLVEKDGAAGSHV